MNSTTSVPISNELLVRLVERYGVRYPLVIESAVEDFLDRTEDDFHSQKSEPDYTWERLKLPAGTLLRTKYRGEWHSAELTNGKFEYDGRRYPSPAKVCNAMRGDTSNNAWKVLELKRPQDIDFELADRLRNR